MFDRGAPINNDDERQYQVLNPNQGYFDNGNSQRYNESQVQCFYYDKFGYFQYECRKKLTYEKNHANYIEGKEVDNSPMLLVCKMKEPSSDNTCYLGTGVVITSGKRSCFWI